MRTEFLSFVYNVFKKVKLTCHCRIHHCSLADIINDHSFDVNFVLCENTNEFELCIHIDPKVQILSLPIGNTEELIE